jgi:hypothetical protein
MPQMTEAERMRKCTMKDKEYIPASGKCLKKCKENLEVRNPTTLRCIKVKEVLSEDVCDRKYNKNYNTKTRRCVKKCTDKQTRNPTTFRCISKKNRPARVATPRVATPRVATPRVATPRVATPRVATPPGSPSIIASISADDLQNSPNILVDLPEVLIHTTPIIDNSLSATELADLKHVCSDTHYCITFGINVDKINKYFGYYLNLNYVNAISKLNQGANGFLLKLNYDRDNYAVSCILKSSHGAGSTNLGYEYLVGQFINKYNKIYPSFIETHQLLKYRSDESRKIVKKKYTKDLNADTQPLQNNVVAVQDVNINNIGMTCNSSDSLCILIQYVNDAKTLSDIFIKGDLDFVKFELINVLYQVYTSLSMMSDVYTHYDLHTSNVIVLKPQDNLYIEYMYHYPNGKIVKFNSQYIAKIIDYGYSYFNDTSSSGLNSADILKAICDDPQCGTGKNKCGSKNGYDILAGGLKKHFINSSVVNRSTDLLLIHRIYSSFLSNKFTRAAQLHFPHIHDFITELKRDLHCNNTSIYGTREDLTNDGKIRNVMQFKDRLERMITSFELKNVNQELIDNLADKSGTLHIYTDGSAPMRYVPYNP